MSLFSLQPQLIIVISKYFTLRKTNSINGLHRKGGYNITKIEQMQLKLAIL